MNAIKAPVFLFLLFLAANGFAATLSVMGPAQVGSGQSFDVMVNVNANDLYAADFDLAYSSNVEFVGIKNKAVFLESDGVQTFSTEPESVDGKLTGNIMTRLGKRPGVNGEGVLSTFSFRALSPGPASFTVSRVMLANSAAQEIPVDNVSAKTVQVGGGAPVMGGEGAGAAGGGIDLVVLVVAVVVVLAAVVLYQKAVKKQ